MTTKMTDEQWSNIRLIEDGESQGNVYILFLIILIIIVIYSIVLASYLELDKFNPEVFQYSKTHFICLGLIMFSFILFGCYFIIASVWLNSGNLTYTKIKIGWYVLAVLVLIIILSFALMLVQIPREKDWTDIKNKIDANKQ
jgi:NADH:ubiquinone oxidoreductase subunit 6 (subunit J)